MPSLTRLTQGLALSVALAAGPAGAALAEGGADGILNPRELRIVDAPHRPASLGICAAGYYLTKKGDHDNGLPTHLKCAEAGYTRSMLFLSHIYQNGYGVEQDPAMSAYWDRRAAEEGNEVGMLNYGLDLIRGYGVQRDAAAGKAWIDKAADGGNNHAKELRLAGYDVRVVTPDSDEAKYEYDVALNR